MRQGRRATYATLAVAALLALVAGAGPSRAQMPEIAADEPVALVADAIDYDTGAGRVTASGHVEVYFGDRTLTADRIVYDSKTGSFEATGSIVLRDPTGVTVYADMAELDEKLRQGLVRGARAVMGENVRLSAVEARRIDDRYNTLSKAVYSPCNVCQDDPTPLWRIRARRVIHDEVEKTVHYEDATFDVMGQPVFWLPYFSHPDPTVDRASGFLVPGFYQASSFGYGVQVPYYWVIDDQSDLTFAPLFTTEAGVIAAGQYRRAFTTGRFEVAGSLTQSDYAGSERLHGDLSGKGLFELGDGYRWGFDGRVVTDDGYLRRYQFSDDDRLTSELFLRRYDTAGFLDLSTVYFQSLRDGEPAGEIPLALPDFDYRHELANYLLGGDLGFFSSATALARSDGPDTSRISLGADWERKEILPVGLELRGFASVRGDVFVAEDFLGPGTETEARLAPLAGVEARFPLIHESGDGVAHVLVPIAQAIVAPYGGNGPEIPNEDSLVTEFDETNLFDTSHFSGLDGFEEGPRLNLGLRYERIAPGGIEFDAALGRVLRLHDANEFSSGSGLDKAASDWVGAWSASYDPYITVRQRMRVRDDLEVTRNEIAGEFSFGRYDLGLGYVFLEKDPTIDAPVDREEIIGRASIGIDSNWSIIGHARRDLERSAFVEAGGGFSYINECCSIDLMVKRRFTESEDAPESTSIAVQVKLFTLGGGPGDGG